MPEQTAERLPDCATMRVYLDMRKGQGSTASTLSGEYFSMGKVNFFESWFLDRVFDCSEREPLIRKAIDCWHVEYE